MDPVRKSELSGKERKETLKCRLCSRDAVSELCRFHTEAKDRVEDGYRHWAKAYGHIGMKAYLHRVIASSETGQWSREVAKLLEAQFVD